MKILIWLTLIFVTTQSYATSRDFEVSALHSFPEWFADSPFLDLQEVKDEAIKDGKKGLMILFTTQGCSYCSHFVQRSLGNSDIAKRVQSQFSTVGLEIFDDAEMTSPVGVSMSVKEFADQEGVGFAPTLLFFDKEGRRVLRQIGYQTPNRFLQLMDYVAEKKYESQSLSEYIASITPQKKSLASFYSRVKEDALFDKPPYVLDRSHFAATKPLLVLFEKSGCPECEVFHNEVLAHKDIRFALTGFQIVRMNVNDSKTPVTLPNGILSNPSTWYKQTSFSRLPALMFYNETGELSLKTDALVLRKRMMNSINYMREKAYLKDWTYQQFARSKAIERNQKDQVDNNKN